MTLYTVIADYGPIVLGAIFTAVAWLFARFWTQESWVRGFVDRLGIEARAVVLEVEQTFVDRVKAGKEPTSDGGVELTTAEKADARRLALAKLKENIGLKGIERALRILGLPVVTEFVDRWLGTHVEAEVKKLTLAQAIAEPPRPR